MKVYPVQREDFHKYKHIFSTENYVAGYTCKLWNI